MLNRCTCMYIYNTLGCLVCMATEGWHWVGLRPSWPRDNGNSRLRGRMARACDQRMVVYDTDYDSGVVQHRKRQALFRLVHSLQLRSTTAGRFDSLVSSTPFNIELLLKSGDVGFYTCSWLLPFLWELTVSWILFLCLLSLLSVWFVHSSNDINVVCYR